MEERNFWSYETRFVRFVLQKFKLGKYETAICERCQSETGVFRLTFQHFCDEFGTFPLRLRLYKPPHPLHTDKRAMLPSLFLRFRETPFYRPYVDFWQRQRESAEDRPVGLVVPRKGLPHGLLIHTGTGLPAAAARGLGLTYNHPDPDGGEDGPEPPQTFIHIFNNVVDALHRNGRGWRPE